MSSATFIQSKASSTTSIGLPFAVALTFLEPLYFKKAADSSPASSDSLITL
jgi:hypothetical protein